MKENNYKTAFAPLLVILIGFGTATVASHYLIQWAFVPLSIVYWGTIFLIVKPSKSDLHSYLKKPVGNIGISALSFIPVLLCIFSFVWGFQYISNTLLIVLWISFAVINSFAEELFWRGYLYENFKWNPSVKIIVSTLFFALSHPIMWGVFSITIRSTIMILPLLIMGLVWGYVYHKTKSLRWCILAHFLVDLLNLSVWVFLNIYVPPVIG